MASNAYCGLAIFALALLVSSFVITQQKSCYREDYDELQQYRMIGMAATAFLAIVGIADCCTNFGSNRPLQILIGLGCVAIAGLLGYLSYNDFIRPCPENDATRLLKRVETDFKGLISSLTGERQSQDRAVKIPPSFFNEQDTVISMEDKFGLASTVLDAASAFLMLMAGLSFCNRGPKGYVYRQAYIN